MRPTAETTIDVALARALLAEQFPDLSGLRLAAAGEGWDNAVFRLGDDLAIRFPRRAIVAEFTRQEQRWLPALSRELPLPVPAPVRIGRPGCGYPWPWSVVPWLTGTTAIDMPSRDQASTALLLGEFVRALHVPAPADSPVNPYRGVALHRRDETFHAQLSTLGSTIDHEAVNRLWERTASAAPWPGPPLWIHGDLHPGNLLMDEGKLCAVIDFVDLSAGDPATDLSVAWMLFPSSIRARFRAAARGDADPIDDATWLRARGWALAFGLMFMTAAADNEALAAVGRRTLTAAIDD
jgi:aminoglycoside phosphotransferase (APT) family kinase protein